VSKGTISFIAPDLELTRIRKSAWWGESFVNELTRISEQAEKKIKVKHQALMGKDSVEETTSNSTAQHSTNTADGEAAVSSGNNSESSTPRRPDAKRATTTL
jgi:trehalose 6-phosphate synthase